jgi:hypothetical protein
MFRKIMIGAVASLSLLSPLAIPAVSQAHEMRREHHDFRVYFRGCDREAWRFGGEFRGREEAAHAARHLRERGFETVVR